MVEVTKELAEKVYKLVEAVKVDGKLRKGANEATKSVERSEAKLVIIADDVEPKEITMHFKPICKEKNIPIINVPSKSELGAAAGLPVSTAAVAVANAGESKKILSSVLKDISVLDEGKAEKPEESIEQSSEPKTRAPVEKTEKITESADTNKGETKAKEKKEYQAEMSEAETPAEEKPEEKTEAKEQKEDKAEDSAGDKKEESPEEETKKE